MYNVGEFSFLVYASNGPESVAVSKGELRISFLGRVVFCFFCLFVFVTKSLSKWSFVFLSTPKM